MTEGKPPRKIDLRFVAALVLAAIFVALAIIDPGWRSNGFAPNAKVTTPQVKPDDPPAPKFSVEELAAASKPLTYVAPLPMAMRLGRETLLRRFDFQELLSSYESSALWKTQPDFADRLKRTLLLRSMRQVIEVALANTTAARPVDIPKSHLAVFGAINQPMTVVSMAEKTTYNPGKFPPAVFRDLADEVMRRSYSDQKREETLEAFDAEYEGLGPEKGS